MSAYAKRVYLGSQGSLGSPVLTYDGAPVVGGPSAFRVTNALPGSLALFSASPGTASAWLPQYLARLFALPPFLTFEQRLVDPTGTAAGFFELPQVPPQACGFQFQAQAAVLDPGAMGSLAFSSAWRIGVGDAGGPSFADYDALVSPALPTQFDHGPGRYALTDLNGDGVTDLVYSWSTFVDWTGIPGFSDRILRSRVAIRLADSAGRLGPMSIVHTEEDVELSLRSLASADLDADGSADLLLGFGSEYVRLVPCTPGPLCETLHVSRHYETLLGNGDGTFQAPLDGSVPSSSYLHGLLGNGHYIGSLALTDVGGDGLPDVVIGIPEIETIAVYRGLGDGTFAPLTHYGVGPKRPTVVRTGDFVGNGIVDVVSINLESDDVSLLVGNGSGSFSFAGSFPVSSLDGLVAVEVADVDGNALDDLVLSGEDVTIVRSLPLAFFGAPAVLPGTGCDAEFTLTGDFDEDGHVDLLHRGAPGPSGRCTTVFRPGWFGTFGAALPSFDAPEGVRFARAEDVDGDGHLDVVGYQSSSSMVVAFGRGDGTFSDVPHVFEASDGPPSVVVGDLDGDGVEDLVFSSLERPEVWAIRGLYDGAFSSFAYGSSIDVGGTANKSATLGDLDGDGVLDLVVARSLEDDLALLHGNGNGSFGAPAVLPVGDFPTSVALGDLDGDGALDVVCANRLSDDVSVSLSDGLGGYAAAIDYPVGPLPSVVRLGDLDGDGNLDLVATNEEGGDLTVRLGTGTGSFGPANHVAVGDAPLGLALADLDGDGDLDAVTANLGSDDLTVLLGQGDGTFSPLPAFQSGDQTCWVEVADLNGDRVPDLAAVARGSDELRIWFGTGGGTFSLGATVPVGDEPHALAICDVDSDGMPDVVVPSRRGDSVWVFPNRFLD